MKSPSIIPAVVLLVTASASADNWHQFRGPTGRGHIEGAGVPTSWDESSIVWKAELKGAGQSSPVTWGDRIYLTGASPDGKERFVQCFSAEDGKLLWERTVPCANPEEAHAMNSRATPSCATDGETVVAFFGPGGLHGFSMDGEPKWELDLGEFPGTWGVAASPILVDGKVIQNADAEGESKLVAVDPANGSIVWETVREAKPKGGWSTPILIEFDGKKELVLNGETGINAYDPATGEDLWFCEGFNGRGSPVPDWDGKRLYVVNGKPGDVYAVEPGGRGDVTATHRVWHSPRKGGRDLPSPVVVDGTLFVTSMSGIATCYDAETGKTLYNERLAEEGIEIAAAPLVADGLIYLTTVHGGDTIVIRPGEKLDIVSVNELGESAANETFRATLTPHRGRLLMRSGSKLYSIE